MGILGECETLGIQPAVSSSYIKNGGWGWGWGLRCYVAGIFSDEAARGGNEVDLLTTTLYRFGFQPSGMSYGIRF